MWPDRVSNPGPLTYESGALPIALRGPAIITVQSKPGLEVIKISCPTQPSMKFRMLISKQIPRNSVFFRLR